MIWVFLFFGLAVADKLDRTYLPPPGFKFSGGSPGAIQVPLDPPNSQYSSTRDEQFKFPQIAIVIDRVGPKGSVDTYQDIYSSSNSNLPFPENVFTTPTTASTFSQATSFSPRERNFNVSPTDSNYTIYHSNDYQNPPDSINQKQAQLQQNPDFFVNTFQMSQNDQQPIKNGNINIPISDVSGNNLQFNSFPHRSKTHGGDIDSIVDEISKSSSTSSPLNTNLINTQYGLDQNDRQSSTPITATHSNTNFISSTTSPAIFKDEFYSSTLSTPQLTSNVAKSSTKINSPFFSNGNVDKRPVRIQAEADRQASILNYENSISPKSYAYSYDTSNGIHADESGITLNGVKAKGSYSYIGDDGKLYSVVYTADENGFRPQGDHLPTSPPIPEAILKVIEQVSKKKEDGNFDDGSYNENKYGYRKYQKVFYDPKNNYSHDDHSVVGQHYVIKNIKTITPNHNEGLRKQTAIGSDQKRIGYQNSNDNDSPIPTKNEYSIDSVNNFENIGSEFPLHSHQLHNKTGIKYSVSYDPTNDSSGNKINNISSSDLLGPENENFEINNERKQTTYVPTDNKMGGYSSFVKRPYTENQSSEYSTESYKKTGYEYNPPQNRGLNRFPSRISEVQNMQNETLKQKNYGKVIRKPFLTPYVPRKGDDIQKYDDYENPFESLINEDDEEMTMKNYKDDSVYPVYSEDDINRQNAHNRTDFPASQSNNTPFEKGNPIEESYKRNEPYSTDKGYFYQKEILDSDKKSYDPFIVTDPSLSYTSSTVPSNNFTSYISMSPSKYIDGKPAVIGQKFIIPSTTPAPYKTNNPPFDYSTSRPGYINQYSENVSPSEDTNTGYSNIEDESSDATPKSEFSTNIPRFGNSYAPNVDLTYTDENEGEIMTEKIIGEDFSGPKQRQRFDPLTGYHY